MNNEPTPQSDDVMVGLPDAGYALATLITHDEQIDAIVWQQVDALLERYRFVGRILAASITELAAIVPLPAAQRIHAARALVLNHLLEDVIDQPADFTNAQTAASYLCGKYGWDTQEKMGILVLNSRFRLIVDEVVYRGNVSCLTLREAELLRPCVIHNAPSVIIWHNHPSGDPTPSGRDLEATESLRESAQTLNISLVDHIIVAGNRSVSMNEQKIGGF